MMDRVKIMAVVVVYSFFVLRSINIPCFSLQESKAKLKAEACNGGRRMIGWVGLNIL